MTQERYTGWVKPRGGYWVAVVESVDWWTCWVKLLLTPAWPGTRRMVLPQEDTPYRLARPKVCYEAQLDRLDAEGLEDLADGLQRDDVRASFDEGAELRQEEPGH